MKTMSFERANELLRYCEETGMLFVRSARKGTRGINTEAGSVGRDGYRLVCIDYRQYPAHRIIWLLKTGNYPDMQTEVDHINGIRTDNRFCNLRLVNHLMNGRNQKVKKNNKTGFPGIRSRYGKWQVQIRIDGGKQKHVGTFETRDEAIAAARKFRESLGYSERHSTDTHLTIR